MSGQVTEQKIIICVRGGVVEDVKKFPENLEVIVEVHDYDIVEEEDEDNIECVRTDEEGETYGLTEY